MIQIATFHSSVHLHIETLMTFPSSAQGDQALTALPSLTIFLNLEGVQECQQAQSLSSVILVSLMNHLHSLKRVVEHLHIHLKAWLVTQDPSLHLEGLLRLCVFCVVVSG